MVTTSPDPAPTPPAEAVGNGPADLRTRAPSGRPALIVLGIAVFIVLTGVLASALISGQTPTTSLSSITVDGSQVQLTPATSALHGIVSPSEPPGDIIGNLSVPAGSRVTHVINIDQGQGQFDRTVAFTTTELASTELVTLYRTLLPRLGWHVLYAGPGSSRAGQAGTEVLAKLGSGDGFYWEVGMVASPATSTGTTPFSVELFELSDDS